MYVVIRQEPIVSHNCHSINPTPHTLCKTIGSSAGLGSAREAQFPTQKGRSTCRSTCNSTYLELIIITSKTILKRYDSTYLEFNGNYHLDCR